MIGTIAASPSSGLKPISRNRARNCSVWRWSLATSSGSRRSTRTASSAEHATGRAAERLAERGRDHVDLAEKPEVLRDPAACLSDDARAVRVVDDERRIV